MSQRGSEDWDEVVLISDYPRMCLNMMTDWTFGQFKPESLINKEGEVWFLFIAEQRI